MTVVYVDSVLLVNGLLNYLLLLTTGHLAGVRLRRLRILLGSVLGALYSLAVYLPNAGFLQWIPVKIGMALLMLWVSFGHTHYFLRLTLLFFAVSFAFGGGVLALQRLSGQSLTGDGIAAVGIRELLFAAALCYLILSLVFRRGAQHGGSRRDVVTVQVRLGLRKAEFCALLDSGNTLKDPVSNLPVIVAETSVLRPLFSKEEQTLLTERALADAPQVLEQLSRLGTARFRLIPYQAVGVASGLLLTLRPDEIIVDGASKAALLALSPTPLSDGGVCRALVGPLEEERHHLGQWLKGGTRSWSNPK